MGNLKVPNWITNLPLAPEFYPTETEFADPIAYISKIEKEASKFGICKVIPPLPRPSKKYTYENLNRSLLRSSESNNRPVFTTRQQEFGCSSSNSNSKKGVVLIRESAAHKHVWQSGEVYTLDEFEMKSKVFAKSHLGTKNDVGPFAIESLFWKGNNEEPIYIEYANDVPGSGFGEPDDPLLYLKKRRRTGRVSRRCGGIGDMSCEKSGKESANKVWAGTSSSSSFVGASASVEGTAGWKLSNSPWNLQVISRSPGSLTRFMLDDIPGVTSPMIYIGMLFSWFAWHVEDHELHSLNYLHTGSSKTWYAIPGDNAFDFEEVIRSQGYGGNLDRVATLSLLGEKTNLLSPEVVVASGIPCCRLVQSPGEYVVTFPRAYHIGFSHGFNCGEAANFGTPQWLTFAKEAAVRRAAMNYLPMLSHQQLLYMLTMSFMSSVPKALLQGVRSSRLKNRQKEERELLVKKAFIDDMMNENKLLSVIINTEATSYAVLWDPESLPSQSKDSQPFPYSATKDTSSSLIVEGQSVTSPWYTRTAEDFYTDDDDLPCGLLVDSGALPCVACGVLGFPFMSIIQPSQRASEELFPADSQVIQERFRDLNPVKPLSELDDVIKSVSEFTDHNPYKLQKNSEESFICAAMSSSEAIQTTCNSINLCHNSESLLGNSTPGGEKRWNISSAFLRPRIFCLEHTAEVVNLLNSKGGANAIIICHSAYPTIKAHAFAVAEEVGAPCNSDEISLVEASQEDLELINISIDDEDNEQCGEDWTSRLGLNIQFCAKLKKQSPTKQDQYALALGGLFCGLDSGSSILSLKWGSKRSRPLQKGTVRNQFTKSPKPNVEKCIKLLEASEVSPRASGTALLQYKRRRFSHCTQSSSTDPLDDVCNANVVIDNNPTSLDGCTPKFEDEVTNSLQSAGISEVLGLVDCTSHVNPGNDVLVLGCFSTLENSETNFSTLEESRVVIKHPDSETIASCYTNEVKTNVSEYLHNHPMVGSSGLLSEVWTGGKVNESSKVSDPQKSSVGIPNVIVNKGTTDEVNMEKIEEEALNCLMSDTCGLEPENETVTKTKTEKSCNDVSGKSKTSISIAESIDDQIIPGMNDGESENQNKTETEAENSESCNEVASDCESETSISIVESFEEQVNAHLSEANDGDVCSSSPEIVQPANQDPTQSKGAKGKRKRELEQSVQDHSFDAFVKGPCEGLRARACKVIVPVEVVALKKAQKEPDVSVKENTGGALMSNIELCHVGLCEGLKARAKKDIVPVEAGSRKKAKRVPGVSVRENVGETLESNLELCHIGPCEGLRARPSKVIVPVEIRALKKAKKVPDIRVEVKTGGVLKLEHELCHKGPCEGLRARPSKVITAVKVGTSKKAKKTPSEVSSLVEIDAPRKARKTSSKVTAPVEESTPKNARKTPSEVTAPEEMVASKKARKTSSKATAPVEVEAPQKTTKASSNFITPVEVETPKKARKTSCKVTIPVVVEAPNKAWKIPSKLLTPGEVEGSKKARNIPSIVMTPVEVKTSKKMGKKTCKIMTLVESEAPKKGRKVPSEVIAPDVSVKENKNWAHKCDHERCYMSFKKKAELIMHKHNICTHKGCGKKFSKHNYMNRHQKVHNNDRPLNCPWDGCKMSFKWEWAKTEHIRVHTKERPYKCKMEGCGLTFRFISHYSKHRRTTGHSV